MLAKAEQTHIAVASNFVKPMKALIKKFEQENDHTIQVSFASSGKLYSQIRNGAPYHLFFSADQEKPNQLVTDNLASADKVFTYAYGKLVLWSNDPNLIQDNETLLTDNFYKIAIANPKLAPFGVAAQQTIESLELTSQLTPKIVRAENVAQAHQFISTGNAELGFIAMGQVFADNHLVTGSVWVVPSNLYEPIQQSGVLLTAAENNVAARAFMLFLQSNEAKHIIQGFGFKTE
ncbi:molybdate ABC transporter substrate-binding protein [Alteromonas sp. 5E99-2]|nr:molybdate ABC transporter substrate-binding protein [Alteromonas sp. 5E99-2]